MQRQETYLPIGSLSLTKEQSDLIKSSFERSLDSLSLFRAVPVSAEDAYVPLHGVPGLAGIVVHYGAVADEAQRGGEVIAALPEEAAAVAAADANKVFATNAKHAVSPQSVSPQSVPPQSVSPQKDGNRIIPSAAVTPKRRGAED
jgi:hypothetical protein